MTDVLVALAALFVGMLPVTYALMAIVGWLAEVDLEQNRILRAVGVGAVAVAVFVPGLVAVEVLTSPDRTTFTEYVTGLILLSLLGLAPFPLLGRRAEANMRAGRPSPFDRLLAAARRGLAGLSKAFGGYLLLPLVFPCVVFMFGSTSLLRSLFGMLVDDRYVAHLPWSAPKWTAGVLIALAMSLVLSSYVDGRKIDRIVRARRSGGHDATDHPDDERAPPPR